MSEKPSRRDFLRYSLAFTGGVILPSVLNLSCAPQPKQPEPEPIQETLDLLERTHQEVIRLAQAYPEDHLVRKVYLGDLNQVSPIYKSPLKVGVIPPGSSLAQTHFGKTELSSEKRFRYFLTRDGSVADYSTLTSMEITISFSPVWLNGSYDEVKNLALEKEAYTIAQWESFSRIALDIYLNQGRIEKIDPTVTDIEIGRTLTRNLLMDDPRLLKLFDYAGYLMFLDKAEQLLASNDSHLIEELNTSNLPRIYSLAREAGVDYRGVVFDSKDYYWTALADNSPWVDIISNPSIPGPVISIP